MAETTWFMIFISLKRWITWWSRISREWRVIIVSICVAESDVNWDYDPPRPWEEGSVDRMLVNHHKCYFGDVPYTMWLSFYYKKSAQLRTENYCTKIPYVHSHASVTTSFIPGNLSPALQPSVLYYVSRGRWRGYWVSYVFFCRYVVYVELIRIRPLALILIRAPN